MRPLPTTKPRAKCAWLLSWLCLLVACGGTAIQARDNYDPNVDWSNMRSFTWLGIQAPRSIAEFDVKRIENSLRQTLVAKGLLERPNAAGTDLAVGAYVGVMPQAIERWERTRGILWTKNADVVASGTLIVEIFALPSGNVVWRGSADRELSENRTPQQKQRSIDQVVGKLLKSFPPPSP